jgi:GntR family transcriptional regulator, transcriptional repressor for pyruvate dehydrogenase complex
MVAGPARAVDSRLPFWMRRIDASITLVPRPGPRGRTRTEMSRSNGGALSPVPRTPLYERLVQRLRAHVVETGLRPGDRFPPERQLAEQLGVSRATLRQAIVALEVQGLIEVRHGGGTFLRRPDLAPAPLTELLDLKRRLPDILDAREALEVKLAELAAERRNEADIEAIDAALTLMADQVEQDELGESGDEAFHRAVAAAAHSDLLAQMYASLADDIRSSRHESLSQVGRPPVSLAQHHAIADAIRAGHSSAASAAMRTHLRSVRDVKLLTWNAPPDLMPEENQERSSETQ